eukprot:GFYU01005581.1.p1 GENE.GFYU01005581.1~~GFYU01005581.1.p1  ORF type:complete len:461 (-),score=70.10 GFYU01005581.1:296-1678(-)
MGCFTTAERRKFPAEMTAEELKQQQKRDKKSLDALMMCITDNDLKQVKSVLRKDPFLAVQRHPDTGNMLLHHAVDKGRVEIVKLLVKRYKTPVDIQNSRGNTPCHIACRESRLEILRWLADKKNADTGIINKDGDTLLHYACMRYKKEQYDCARLLMETFKLKPLLRDKAGQTAVHFACMNGLLDILKLMVDKWKIDPTLHLDNDGDQPIHYAVIKGHQDVFQYMVDTLGISPTMPGAHGRTPLHYAAKYGHVDLVQLLVEEYYVDKRIMDKLNGSTPLHYACDRGQLAVIDLYCGTWRVSPMTRDRRNGLTAFHKACYFGHLKAVKKMFDEYQAQLDMEDKDGNTPYKCAIQGKANEVAAYLRPRMARKAKEQQAPPPPESLTSRFFGMLTNKAKPETVEREPQTFSPRSVRSTTTPRSMSSSAGGFKSSGSVGLMSPKGPAALSPKSPRVSRERSSRV